MEREEHKLAPYVAIAAPIVMAVIVAIAAYVDRKVAPLAEYVAQVTGARAPQVAKPAQAERVAAAAACVQ
jgi:hypothetical protein